MFESLHNSRALFRTTLDILARDKELMVFPILSGLAGVAVMATFAGGAWGLGLFDELMHTEAEFAVDRLREEWPLLVAGFLYYFANFFVITYFNAALVGAAHIRLTGGDPTISDGIRLANGCLPAIFGYSAIAATVGMLLKLIESRTRNNFLAGLAVSLAGVAWTLVTYLVVPVLVIERLGAAASVRRSGSLLKKTWGEQIVAGFGFGALGFLLSLIGFVVIFCGAVVAYRIGQPGGTTVLIGSIAAAVIYWLVLGVVLSALRGIYTAALYAHATEQPVEGFPRELLRGAFHRR